MSKKTKMIQMNDLQAGKMLEDLAKEDIRSFGSETAYLIRKEWFARFGVIDTEDNTPSVDQKQPVPKAQ